MKQLAPKWLHAGIASFVLLGLMFSFAAGTVLAQPGTEKGKEDLKGKEPKKGDDKGKDPKKDTKIKGAVDKGIKPALSNDPVEVLRSSLRGVVREGYTRPATNPDLIMGKNNIRRVATSGEIKGVGATLYYLVLELRNPKEGDTWGTGVPGFDETFRAGRDLDNTYSPALDTEAKYLYLYQVVNDRAMSPVLKERAVTVESETEPVSTAMVRLRVHPRYITSWGSFTSRGFVLNAVDLPFKIEKSVIRAVSTKPDENAKPDIIAVSATSPLVRELPEPLFRQFAPAVELPHMLEIGSAVQGLSRLSFVKGLMAQRGKIKMASWSQNIEKSAKFASEPAFVRLARVNFEERIRFASGQSKQFTIEGEEQLVFRADWLSGRLLAPGEHSTVFGFTTDLPPIDEGVIVANLTGAGVGIGARTDGILPAAAGGAAAAANAIAPAVAGGTAPGPVAAAAAAPGGGGAVGGLGGQVGGGGGGGIGASAIPGGFGQPGQGNGGGMGGGTGGGNGGGNGSGDGGRRQEQEQDQKPGDINIEINVNQTQTQTQNQTQSQKQRQNQNQRQNQTGGGNGEVIPEPGAMVLGLLGLPALYFAYRRRRKTVK